jgi:trehalose synthase
VAACGISLARAFDLPLGNLSRLHTSKSGCRRDAGVYVHEVGVEGVSVERLAPLIGDDRRDRFERAASAARDRLGKRRVVNVNSTARGGGVAELLQTLLGYSRGAGLDVRWIVIDGDTRFFEITKRIHNHLYGTAGDGGPLGAAERSYFEDIGDRNAAGLREYLADGDIVVLHDPQTAAIAPRLVSAEVAVVWRCHVGLDVQNEHSERGWDFLRPYLTDADAFVFSRRQFAPSWVSPERLVVIPPSIDPFSAKNTTMPGERATGLLQQVGLLEADGRRPALEFTRRDGSRGEVQRRVDLCDSGSPPSSGVPIVLQASRWDAMKDMQGVMAGFAEAVAGVTDAHLVLAGPEVGGVDDDPEAAVVLAACQAAWSRLPDSIRERIHLVCVPMADGDEAATIVNALQRHATVVVQKSLAEGFGLTVTEAMWKSRPVVASAVGGIVDQVVSGRTGWLVGPEDFFRCGSCIRALLDDPATASAMGVAGHERAVSEFLADRHLEQWAALFERLP